MTYREGEMIHFRHCENCGDYRSFVAQRPFNNGNQIARCTECEKAIDVTND